jgi:hypothetical protein
VKEGVCNDRGLARLAFETACNGKNYTLVSRGKHQSTRSPDINTLCKNCCHSELYQSCPPKSNDNGPHLEPKILSTGDTSG